MGAVLSRAFLSSPSPQMPSALSGQGMFGGGADCFRIAFLSSESTHCAYTLGVPVYALGISCLMHIWPMVFEDEKWLGPFIIEPRYQLSCVLLLLNAHVPCVFPAVPAHTKNFFCSPPNIPSCPKTFVIFQILLKVYYGR